jgi:hypothetical protein
MDSLTSLNAVGDVTTTGEENRTETTENFKFGGARSVEEICESITNLLQISFKERAHRNNYFYDGHAYYKFYENEGLCTLEASKFFFGEFERLIREFCQKKGFNVDEVNGTYNFSKKGIDYIYVRINWFND